MTGDVDVLDGNWATFGRLVALSERRLQDGRRERAAVDAMTAATFAWCNPTGVFASARLERVLARLGTTGLPPAPVRPSSSAADDRPRVLHVASQLYDTGGHTQMLANWLRLDAARRHHLCVTGQQGRAVPRKITDALGGPDDLSLLDEPFRGLVDRAASLRTLAAGFDHVLLHVHPNDVVACIAFAHRPAGGPEVLLVNHADHVFWLGSTVADRIVNLRHSGAALNVERRGIAEGRNALLVRPLHLGARERTREEARAVLGIDPEHVVVASAADTYKYGAPEGESLLDVLLPVLRASPTTRLHVAGPAPDGDWAVLADEGLGKAWGVLPEVRTLMEAADVYVDSYPFSSLTSMLEAAALDVPVLTLRKGGEEVAVLCADTPELDDHLVVARSADELASEVSSLVLDPGRRERLGAATGDAVRRAHADGAWESLVDKVLAGAGVVSGSVCGSVSGSPPTEVPRRTGSLDRRLLEVMRHGVGQGLTGTLDVMAPQLPWSLRVSTAVRLLRRRKARVALLLPAPWARVARRARRRITGHGAVGA